jgi:hypothetical protein
MEVRLLAHVQCIPRSGRPLVAAVDNAIARVLGGRRSGILQRFNT